LKCPLGVSGECYSFTILGQNTKTKRKIPKKRVKEQFCILNDMSSCINDASQYNLPQTLKGRPCSVLSDDLRKTSQNEMIDVISNLQNRVRLGDTIARTQIQELSCICAFSTIYPRFFHNQEIQTHSGHIGITIQDMPDVTTILHQCMLPTKQYEDDFVVLLRSCVPFFQNPRRVKHDHAWAESGDDSLLILIRCCLATLLSLYPHISVKDVDFDIRVNIIIFFRNLIIGSFQDRNIFYVQNKTLIKICIMEYIYYFMQNVNPLPQTAYMRNVNILVMSSNIFNIGQQLRVDINSAYSKIRMQQENPACIIGILFSNMKSKCHVMFERSARYNKNSLSVSYAEMYDTKKRCMLVSNKQKQRHTKTEILTKAIVYLSEIPYTNNFSIFNSYCTRRSIPLQQLNTIWDTMRCVRVYELSELCIQNQTLALSRYTSKHASYNFNKQKFIRTLVLCINCTQNYIFPTFRHDVRHDVFMCNTCNITESVFEIDMLGRVAVVCGTPLVLSTCCANIVVLTGNATELQCVPKSRNPTEMIPCDCKCIVWGRNTNTLSFHSIIASMTTSQSLVCASFVSDKKEQKWPIATRNYMQQRMNGNISHISIPDSSKYVCCMCHVSTIQNKYNLLDIYNNSIVVIPVCSKHSMYYNADTMYKTIQAYLLYIYNRTHKI